MKWLFDSAAPAASSLLGSFSPFVSTDQLPQTEGLEPGGVGQPGGMLMGKGGVERDWGGCFCDWTHLMSSRWNIPAVCGNQRCCCSTMTFLLLQALDPYPFLCSAACLMSTLSSVISSHWLI